MLSTIDLDDKALFATDEIDKVGTDWNLTHEFMPAKRACAQAVPKF